MNKDLDIPAAIVDFRNMGTDTQFDISKTVKLDRCIGALVGLAVGDALGTTNEFSTEDEVIIVDSLVGGGPFALEPGQWTDDTSMALCLADSIIENGFDMKDQLDRYVAWNTNGYNSCTGTCFDIGAITYQSLSAYNRTGNVISKNTHPSTSGNGGIMRLAPVVIKYTDNWENCVSIAQMQSMTTHGSTLCKEAAALMAEIMLSCIHRTSDDKNAVTLPASFTAFTTYEINHINDGNYKSKSFDAVFNDNGFVASSLEFALWCFYNTNSFKECVMLAANAGGDADTNAAIAGQLAGAYYGYDDIPTEWTNQLVWHDKIYYTAKALTC